MSLEPISMRRSSPPLDTGRVLGGRFEIRGILGEGASGIVYDARRLGEGEIGETQEGDPAHASVALKVLHPHLLGDEQLRGRFQREVAILRRLEGEHLCPIIDFGEVEDPRDAGSNLLYMALPKVDGPSLERLIATEGRLPLERVIDVGLQICSALASAHGQGIVHRDLKPANVLMRAGTYAVVVDFGMAKILAGPGGTGTTALTSHNMVFGTPEYMAPEQARGDELDARCDLYAVGIILYQLIAGEVPFRGASPLNVLTAQMTCEPEPLRQRVPERGVSAALEAVVSHALAKSPDERYAGAGALATALAHARVYPTEAAAVHPRRIDANDSDADPHAPTMPSPIPAPLPTPSVPSAPPTSSPAAPSSRRAKTTPPSRPARPPRSRPTVPQHTAIDRDASWWGGPGWALFWLVATAIGVAVGVWLSLREP